MPLQSNRASAANSKLAVTLALARPRAPKRGFRTVAQHQTQRIKQDRLARPGFPVSTPSRARKIEIERFDQGRCYGWIAGSALLECLNPSVGARHAGRDGHPHSWLRLVAADAGNCARRVIFDQAISLLIPLIARIVRAQHGGVFHRFICCRPSARLLSVRRYRASGVWLVVSNVSTTLRNRIAAASHWPERW